MDAKIVNMRQVTHRIQKAAECLATNFGNLRDRFPKANALFLTAGENVPTKQAENLYEELRKCLRNVKQGDFTKITDDELERAAQILMELNKLSIQFRAEQGWDN
jgi:hypothetical protein